MKIDSGLLIALPLVYFVLLSGCGGQGGGVAPSRDLPTSPNIQDFSDSILRSGLNVSGSGGWSADVNAGEPTKSMNINGGWTVEVRYE